MDHSETSDKPKRPKEQRKVTGVENMPAKGQKVDEKHNRRKAIPFQERLNLVKK